MFEILTEVRRRILILVKTDKGRCSYISIRVRDGAGETATDVIDKRRAVDNLEIIDCLFSYVIPIECSFVAMLRRFSGNFTNLTCRDT